MNKIVCTIKRSVFFTIFLIVISGSTFSQTKENVKSEILNEIEEAPKKKTFLKKLWGDQLRTSITAMPVGLHTDFKKHNKPFSNKGRSTINGLHEVLYFGFNYKSIEAIVFQNSFGDATFGLLYKRAWNFTKRFSVNFGLGVVYGYDGRLRNTEGIPFRDTFLIKGDINPVSGFEFDYRFYKKWSVHASLAPRIIIYGFRYIL